MSKRTGARPRGRRVKETRGRKAGVPIKTGRFYLEIERLKKALILQAEARHKGDVTAMAADLEIQRTYLYTLMKTYGIAIRAKGAA